MTTLSDYDPQGRLTRQTACRNTDDVGAGTLPQPLIERRYCWDVSDRLVETLDLASGLRRYQYDATERLIGVEGDAPERFVVDPAGNILGSSSDSGAGSPGIATGDRLLLRGDAKFEYDGCGNRVREVRGAGGNVERLYRYRADNQLAEVEERSRRGRRITSFAYDALGRRTVKRSTAWGSTAANDSPTSPGTMTCTNFVWSGSLLLAESGTVTDPLAIVYLHEPSSFRPLAQVRRANPAEAGTLYHYQLDHLGTPQEVTNDDGRIVWQARLKAWGGVAKALVAKVVQPIRFQGQYHDAETGLYYNRFRYYASDEGCYVQQDPIGLRGGTNVGAYVRSPTVWIDPLGLASCAFVDSDGTLNLRNKFPAGSDEDLALQQHVDDWNNQIAANGGSMTRQAVTPSMRDDADAAASAARSADPSSYPAGIAAGHTPDVGWGGDPAGPINPVNKAVNSYVGGATQAIPPGTSYTGVKLFR